MIRGCRRLTSSTNCIPTSEDDVNNLTTITTEEIMSGLEEAVGEMISARKSAADHAMMVASFTEENCAIYQQVDLFIADVWEAKARALALMYVESCMMETAAAAAVSASKLSLVPQPSTP